MGRARRRHARVSWKPDIVHANNFFCPANLPGSRCVHAVRHEPDSSARSIIPSEPAACFNGLFDASLHADHIVSISEHSRNRFLKWFPHVEPASCVGRLSRREALDCGAAGEDEDREVLRKFELTSMGSGWRWVRLSHGRITASCWKPTGS